MPDQTHNIDWKEFVEAKFTELKDTAKQQYNNVDEMSVTLSEIIETADELQNDISDLQNDVDENYIVRPKWPEYFGIAELIDILTTTLPTPDYGKQENSLRQLHELRQACANANIVDLDDLIKHIKQ
tara:strand:+ start:1288 stop:1668 length:381 start_codon:yes stop_codon:yes gene_type:complete